MCGPRGSNPGFGDELGLDFPYCLAFRAIKETGTCWHVLLLTGVGGSRSCRVLHAVVVALVRCRCLCWYHQFLW